MSVRYRRSLLARIDEHEARNTRVVWVERERGHEQTFAERYQGTGFAAPMELVSSAAPIPRGRVYLIVLGAAALVTVALAVVGNAG